ncbi:unnamed protein product [Cuscuta campestris]|uniref:Reverse transcriptase domain-containing protein n=1 Tax=Cuscuta campestris TaxID=132261 RepID=A0A484LMZ8_9ASTE|nr:unnamed protein product [Cuscuta campestris]
MQNQNQGKNHQQGRTSACTYAIEGRTEENRDVILGLSFLLQKAEQRELVHGIQVSSGAPLINHLLFADDSLILFKATMEEAGVVLWILSEYERLSGQNIRMFNVAMLGKQGWRFLTNPSSLVARVFKARYFPNNSFLEAELGIRPSYCWKSILSAQDVLRGGIRRRICDGQETHLWGTPWLLEEVNPYPSMARRVENEDPLVADFIDFDLHSWNIAKLEQYFEADEVLQIRRVPVNTRSCDGWFWLGDFRRAYTVKNSVWRLMGKGGNRASLISFQNWFQDRCQNDTLMELRTIAWTCWEIWKAQNIATWDHKTLLLGELKKLVLSMEAQWSNKADAEREHTSQRHDVSLRAEAHRCFFDAATSGLEDSFSFGCVLFYPGGVYVAAANGRKLGPLDPLLAEALVCKENVGLVEDSRYSQR